MDSESKELVKKISTTRTVPFFGKLDGDLYSLVRNSLLHLSKDSTKPITILFDSWGGITQFSLMLGDVVSRLPCEVTGVAIDARSAACTVLQCCHHRLIMPNGVLLVHSSKPNDQSFSGAKYEHREDWGRMFWGIIETQNVEIRKLFVQRTKLSEGRVNEIFMRGDQIDYPILAREAVELNLVDDVVSQDYKLFSFPKRKEEKKEDDKKDFQLP
jgi:ATP-dependent protease ClpP protease subunit